MQCICKLWINSKNCARQSVIIYVCKYETFPQFDAKGKEIFNAKLAIGQEHGIRDKAKGRGNKVWGISNNG